MRADLLAEKATRRIEGPLLFLERSVHVGLNHAVEVISDDGITRTGRVAALDDETIVVEVLASTSGLSLAGTRVRLYDTPLRMPMGPGLLGRVFDSVGRPIDGGPPIIAEQHRRVDGLAINPAARALPRDFIETSISTIDLMNSLVRGQKLPIFSGGGLPHDRLATAIAQRARLRDGSQGEFSVVFVGIGVSHDSAMSFQNAMADSGALQHTAMFLNRAD
ncbi:MAG: V-type ATP synthase subunit B, partial [Gammaproteobacteria bacterium]|nr:V-type ATP synthase subunit B [Gammaproteobacteria bacterium]